MGGLVLGVVGEELREVTLGLVYPYAYISLHGLLYVNTFRTYLYKPVHAGRHVHVLLHSSPHAHMLPSIRTCLRMNTASTICT